jgi:RimJ/RimL family protein N-acetyltransferase
VDPDRDLAGAIRIARSLLQQGYSIVWFPEGRRSPTGTLESFQGGVGLLLEDAHVPAVPTAIFGTFEAWPKHARRPRRYRLAVAFGKPRRSTPDGEPRIHAQLHEDVRRLLAAGPSGNAADGELRSPEGTVMAIPDTVTIETLADGSRVAIRPIRREDVECNAAFIRGLSPPSKHFLFLGGISELGEEALRRLCDPDQAHDMAFVAFPVGADGMPDARQIGVCRYAGADSEQGAEISVAVADDWQHKGLGTRLLERLIEHARRHGVRRLYSIDAADNARMRKLAAKLGFQEEPNPDDIREVVFSRELP